MSSLIVEVCAVEEIKKHPNADRLEMVRVKNWWCVTGIGNYKVGDKCVYFPPDSVIPEELADRFEITKYCALLGKEINGQRPPGLRIKASRFRGEASFGTIQHPDNPEWEIGKDVKDYYNVTKYEPPVKATDGDAASPVPAFHSYTEIENIGNFPGIFEDGEEVVVTEKIHGTNCRVGLVFYPNEETGQGEWQWMAGSHNTRRKEYNEKGCRSLYWFPLMLRDFEKDPLRNMISSILVGDMKPARSVIAFGEIYGYGVQDMQYGMNGAGFKVFDVCVDGSYVSYDQMKTWLTHYGVDEVPLLYRGPFSMDVMEKLVSGPTTLCEASKIREDFKGREGIVIRPAKERFNFDLGGSGRVVLKYVSADYHDRRNKNRTEDH